jgi:hypothetical protein
MPPRAGRLMTGVVAWLALAIVAGSASAQESKADASKAESTPKIVHEDAVNPTLDKCITMPPLDLTVLDDGHVYVQTRGRNHYLLSTGECKDLKRSYVHGEVELVPYGRRVCQSDGSYIVYRTAGHDATCAILTIDRVSGRAEARSRVEHDESEIEVTKAPPLE